MCVKTGEGGVFEGYCWSGTSVWLDYLNPKAQEYWANLYSLERYKETTKDVFIWNDMNEPTTFSNFEITVPKPSLYYT